MRKVNLLFAIVFGCGLFYSLSSAEAAPPEAVLASSAKPSKSEKGLFSFETVAPEKVLKVGPNSVDIVLRDRNGGPVEGARLTVTPWMPTMGHGVWDKPVTRERGGGNYRIDNVVLIMGGLWELRFTVKRGNLEDKGVLSFQVPETAGAQREPEKPQASYQKSLASYRVPPVFLLNQDGRRVNLAELLDSGKPVIVDFIFTTCTTVCPILSASFSNLRRELGEAARDVQLVSISIDPENDRPEVLKRYSDRFEGGPGWEFLTGDRDDVGKVLEAFDAFVTDKMSHEPLYLLRAPGEKQWIRIRGLIKKSELLNEYHGIKR